MIRLKYLVNMILEDTSDELVKIARTANGLITPKGEPIAVPGLQHIDFLVKQPKYKQYEKRLKVARGNDWSTLYRVILDDALKNGWIRIVNYGSDIAVHGRRDVIKKRRKLIDDIVLFINSVKKRQINIRWEFVK